MELYQCDNVIGTNWSSVEVTKLIRKLRWIGLTEEAVRFQHPSYDPYTRRQGVLADMPYSTD